MQDAADAQNVWTFWEEGLMESKNVYDDSSYECLTLEERDEAFIRLVVRLPVDFRTEKGHNPRTMKLVNCITSM